ncbi:MAG TPA: MTAP family purine nucleoside phosphorylase [bacterium]
MGIRKNHKISALIIGGSKAYELKKTAWGREIDSLKIKTPYGCSNPVRIYEKSGVLFGFISRHGEQGYSKIAGAVNYPANIYAAKTLGVNTILSWSGPGAISNRLKPGMFFIPDDLMDLTKKRIYTFFEKKGLGFIRQNPVFCPEISAAIKSVLSEARHKYRAGGVYVCTEGPRLETPAEIRAFRMLGGDAVGMTVVPEVFLAKELEICYAVICYISNYAEGVKPLQYKKGELFEGTLPARLQNKVKHSIEILPEIMLKVLRISADRKKECNCSHAMLRYKREGRISGRWRDWLK